MLDDVREHQEHAAEAWLLLRRGLVPGEGACTVDMCLIERPQVDTCHAKHVSADMIRYSMRLCPLKSRYLWDTVIPLRVAHEMTTHAPAETCPLFNTHSVR